MSNASMALLQGSKKNTPPPAVLAKESPAAAAATDEGEEMAIDIDGMSDAEIEALVTEHKIEVPGSWKKMKLAAKKIWLNEKFGEGEDNAAEQKASPAAAKAAATAAAKAPAAKATAAAEGKAGGKGKGKGGTAVAVQDSLAGEVQTQGDDIIVDTVHEIENLKEVDARKLVTQLREESEFSFFKLGGVLALIQANGWFAPHETFREYIENEHGIAYRRAMYWVTIYNGLVEAGVPWDLVKGLGWTKLAALVPVLTKANAARWVKKADVLTVLQLEAAVKHEVQKKAGTLAGTPGEPSAVTTKTFKVHADQRETIEAALKKARDVANTTADTVALEFICLDYLGGNAKKAASLPESLAAAGIDEALEAFNKAFPSANLTLTTE